MAEINIYKKFFEKKILPFMNRDSKRQDKLIYYLKIYTHLISSLDKLKSRRGFDRLKIVEDLTREESYSGEAHHIKHINSLVRDVLNHKRRIQRILNKDPVADPLHSKTQLLMAQNICVLRILKIKS